MNIKKIAYLLLSATVLTLPSACYDDDSTFADGHIKDVTINSSDSSVLYVNYLDELDLNPVINRGEASDTAGLTYKWQISEGTSGNTSQEWIDLGNEASLHAVINNDINSRPYDLCLTVTDNANGGLQYRKWWSVYVRSSFLDGIAVADTRNGSTSDFNLIMGKSLTLNYGDRKDKVTYDILQKATGKPYDKLITALTYNSQGYLHMTHVNNLWAISDDGDLALYNLMDFSQTARLSKGGILTYEPEGIKARKVFSVAMQYILLSTNQYLYSVNSINTSNFGWYDSGGTEYPIDNNVVMASSRQYDHQIVMWYDSEDGCFVEGERNTMSNNSLAYDTDIAANSYFDPQHMTGYTALTADESVDGSVPTFLLKNNADGSYAIYTFVRHIDQQGEWNADYTEFTETSPEVPASAKMKYNIPAEGKALLDKAVSVFFATNQAILYVATPTGIYAINFAGTQAVVNTTPVFTPASGETIAKAKLYRQGVDMQDISQITDGNSAELPLNRKAVMVATQSAEYAGKLLLVPMKQIGTGNLDASNAQTWSGFGKILDFCTTAY